MTYFPTTTKRPTNKPTAQWPPPVPTHSTTKFPQHDTVGSSCGAKNGNQDQERIVGGQNASPNEWPWIAVLFNGGRQFCGGNHLSYSIQLKYIRRPSAKISFIHIQQVL